MYKICLIIPYFGEFKNYFQLFLNSCANNPTINWLIFTDSDQAYFYPDNVKKIKMNFDEFALLVRKNFDFEIELDKPYKLCDFKPAYGEILSDYLKEYDFWGYCDCDMIFGNIRHFLTDEILKNYDKIFSRGHLSLYKNTKEINEFYRKQKVIDYKKIFTSSQSYAFDEWPGVSGIWEKLGKDYFDELCMDDIRVGFDGFRLTKEISGCLSPYHSKNSNEFLKYKKMKYIYYDMHNGILKRRWFNDKCELSEEILYVHFQKRNMKIKVNNLIQVKEYYIIDDSFVNRKKLITNYVKKTQKDTFKNKYLRLKYNLYKIKISLTKKDII